MRTPVVSRPARASRALLALVVCLASLSAISVSIQAAQENPSSAGGRYVAMVSPNDGEEFVAPLNLRLVAIGHDDRVFTNVPGPGKGTNAAKVEFFIDNTKIYEQLGADAEYHVFKGFVRNLDVAPGTHEIWARATYVNPALVLDSPPFTITVLPPRTYTQTVDLTADVVLSGTQSYELIGAPDARIRLNGNGFRIRSAGTSGKLTLKFVDVFGLGSAANGSQPGLDLTMTSAGAVAIEDSVFDDVNPLQLRFDGSSAASVKRNMFRSNLRNPVGQQPGAPETIPALTFLGSSSAPKTFGGNNVGAGPILFDRAKQWTIGWAAGNETDEDSNVLMGPRAAFELQGCANMTVRGNFLRHNYYGGWSQGQLLELHNTTPILVEHNVLLDSSWPVRGLAGEFRYNLVLEAGHQWMVVANNAYVHHNLFIGGDNDTGGITGYYDGVSARIENNTFDGLNGSLVSTAISWRNGTTTLKSNAFINWPSRAVAVVEHQGGTIEADYNGFFAQESTRYSNMSAPAHDLNGGAQTDPKFTGPLPTTTFDMDLVAVWKRTLAVDTILSAYRTRYTPSSTSPYIDAGDPAGGAGNDVGAIGAGVPNVLDQFGIVDGASLVDTDEDGLPFDWETRFKLNPDDATGDHGAAGDPDRDGVSNLDEYRHHTHPRGVTSLTRYFAEGSNGSFFQTTLDLANPGTQTATVVLRYLRADGSIVPAVVTLAGQRHLTLTPANVSDLASADFSTVIEADVPIVAERTMVWTEDKYGSHTETSVKAPATEWFLAEGATHGVFSLFYLLANATDSPAEVEIRYLLSGGQAPIVRTYTVDAHARRTIPVDDEPGLSATDVSGVVRSKNGVPIIAERAMYFTTGGQSFRGGHASAGVTQPGGHWFFAEGATGTFFNTFLLLANPDQTRTAHVTVSYLLPDGTVIPVTHDLPPNSRQTYNIALEHSTLADAIFSTVVDSNVPIVAERSMYWPTADWAEAHNTPGATETGTRWAVAGGEEGGASNAQTYVLIANTSSVPGTARVTVLREGSAAPLTHDVDLPPNSRTNVAIGATSAFAAVAGTRFGVLVESLGASPAQIVIERATYSNDTKGVVWAAGANTLGTRLQ